MNQGWKWGRDPKDRHPSSRKHTIRKCRISKLKQLHGAWHAVVFAACSSMYVRMLHNYFHISPCSQFSLSLSLNSPACLLSCDSILSNVPGFWNIILLIESKNPEVRCCRHEDELTDETYKILIFFSVIFSFVRHSYHALGSYFSICVLEMPLLGDWRSYLDAFLPPFRGEVTYQRSAYAPCRLHFSPTLQ